MKILTFEEKIQTAIESFGCNLWEGKFTKEQAMTRTKDYIMELFDELIDGVMERNYPKDETKLPIEEQVSIMKYRLACEDIKNELHLKRSTEI